MSHSSTGITELSAGALVQAIRARQISCRELMQATLARIAAVNPVHNAIVSLRDGDELLREADARDHELSRGTAAPGWMHGLPNVIVGDLILHAATRALRAGTRSRGAWELTL